jgi:hypothetical protein
MPSGAAGVVPAGGGAGGGGPPTPGSRRSGLERSLSGGNMGVLAANAASSAPRPVFSNTAAPLAMMNGARLPSESEYAVCVLCVACEICGDNRLHVRYVNESFWRPTFNRNTAEQFLENQVSVCDVRTLRVDTAC